jgi:hypothetical protein
MPIGDIPSPPPYHTNCQCSLDYVDDYIEEPEDIEE